MHLRQIIFNNFRNFVHKTVKFNSQLTFVIGKNSHGKTNLLEGINFLLKGVGFRDSKEEELIKLGSKESSVKGELAGINQSLNIGINLNIKSSGLEKSYFLDRTKKNRSLYLKEVIATVLFSPEQIEIIIGPPNNRRLYFDIFLSITNPLYKSKLNNYQQALKKRNRLLETVHDEIKLKEELEFWNRYLQENGSYITEKRSEYIKYLNYHKDINSKIFSIIYKKNEFSRIKLEESFSEEKRLRRTIVGPHRDDFQIFLNDLNVNLYGSRSEERLALFWLKMNELRYWEKISKNKPILLLDDIFSELDIDNQKVVLSLINQYQTVATTTDKLLIKLVDFPDKATDHTIDL